MLFGLALYCCELEAATERINDGSAVDVVYTDIQKSSDAIRVICESNIE